METFLCLLIIASLAPADPDTIPPIPESITPDCIRVCPNGDICHDVQVLWNDEPVANAPVRMVFSPSAGTNLYWCPAQPHPVIEATTDEEGECTFCIKAGGCHPWDGPNDPPEDDPWTVIFEVDPGAIVLDVYEDIGSPDCHADGSTPPNGDGDVDLLDFVTFAQMYGDVHHCGDYNDDGTYENDGMCDEDVDLLDFVVFSQHFGHTCDIP